MPPAADPRPVLVFGSGHLASRVRSLAAARSLGPVPWPWPTAMNSPGSPGFGDIREALTAVDFDSVSAAILADDGDARNLELAIALISVNARLPIVLSMFNENVAPHLQAANPNVRVL